ncbi:MAG: AAA family ATPase [Mycoplasmataceae bacterium]|nr:AAA family ATPase [Mycoplasmataceae bacterium]
MIFLKSFKANGFKSFAQNVTVDFTQTMSGIVGPNGSGKSNIVDAIKWVLGERSSKTLRGKTSEDIIFHGSKGHDQSKYAEVTLTFSNTAKSLHYDGKDVAITRKLTRGAGTNEYFINGEPCRLKDVQDIFLDTGLSKGSLGIISQGTVQWFVEAKPEDRRTIFEEAAGIGLYTKKKDESNAQLARTEENLNRIMDITNELGSDVKKLSKQAEKAKVFAEKRKELMHLDLTITVKDLRFFQEKLIKIIGELKNARNELEVFEPDTKAIIESLKLSKEKMEIADKNIEVLTQELTDLIEQINKVELKKSNIKNKLESDISGDNVEKRAEAYRQLLATTKFELEDAKKKAEKLRDEIDAYNDTVEKLTSKRNELMELSNKHSIRLAETRMEVKNIRDAIESRSHLDIGVKTIIENKQALSGVHGVVRDFLNVKEEYEKAIVTALGRNIQNVIVDSTDDAKTAVDFLKRNKSGKATFLPLDTIKPRNIKDEHLEVLKMQEGFINTANNLVEFDNTYANAFNYLLGNVIVANDLNTAAILSKYTYQIYRVVSLDGDIIAPGGVITGGFNRISPLASINLEGKLTDLEKEFNALDIELVNYRIELDKTTAELNEVTFKQNEKKLLLSRYDEVVRANEGQFYKYEMDYDQLVKRHDLTDKREQWSEQTLNDQIAKLSSRKDKVSGELSVSRQNKSIHKAKVDDLEAKLTELRFMIDKHRDTVAAHETEKVRCEAVVDNARNKISQNYHMTIEYASEHYNSELPMSDNQARETVSKLQAEIDRLGSINMEAIDELESKQKRYEELLEQQKELEKAKNDIVEAIRELDIKAKEDFTKTIDSVNETLPSVFKYLFGGGSCHVEYVDPENVLTSGIDVSATPPGKNMAHLNLLSGGEKTLVALSILFAILKNKSFPLVILDEAESALDPANVERFGNIIHENANKTQFIVITHRPGTMERCDVLFGATMQTRGVTSLFKVSLAQAKDYGSDKIEE